jgi:hypothetical protein
VILVLEKGEIRILLKPFVSPLNPPEGDLLGLFMKIFNLNKSPPSGDLGGLCRKIKITDW